MADIAWSAISGGSQVVRKSIVINSSQNWTAPINLAGNQVWLTGTAGGGSGAGAAAANQHATGGSSGGHCEKFTVQVTAGSTYLVTIGGGGNSVIANANQNGNDGGDTSFAALLVLKGGKGGVILSNSAPTAAQAISLANASGGVSAQKPMVPTPPATAAVLALTDRVSLNGNSSGESVYDSVDNQLATGGAAGLFGNGTSGTVTTNAANAGNNTGAGGGAYASTATATSGAGGSGKLIIEWDEFL